MKEIGYLYILINPSLVGLVKIGKTSRDPEQRARELSQATGVATPFYVAYSLQVSDADAAERYLHTLLENQGYRLTANREFFQMTLQKAIELMMDVQEFLPIAPERNADSSRNLTTDDDLMETDSSDLGQHPGNDIYQQAIDHELGLGDAIQDMDEALRLLEIARKLDYPAAYTRLADYYSGGGSGTGYFEPRDTARAMEYLREGAMRGHCRCYAEMALLFRHQGHMENFMKCWKKYFTAQTFLRDDDNKWSSNAIVGAGKPRISYIEFYLYLSILDNFVVPADILAILAPFREELISSIKSSITLEMELSAEYGQITPNSRRNMNLLLQYVEAHL